MSDKTEEAKYEERKQAAETYRRLAEQFQTRDKLDRDRKKRLEIDSTSLNVLETAISQRTQAKKLGDNYSKSNISIENKNLF